MLQLYHMEEFKTYLCPPLIELPHNCQPHNRWLSGGCVSLARLGWPRSSEFRDFVVRIAKMRVLESLLE